MAGPLLVAPRRFAVAPMDRTFVARKVYSAWARHMVESFPRLSKHAPFGNLPPAAMLPRCSRASVSVQSSRVDLPDVPHVPLLSKARSRQGAMPHLEEGPATAHPAAPEKPAIPHQASHCMNHVGCKSLQGILARLGSACSRAGSGVCEQRGISQRGLVASDRQQPKSKLPRVSPGTEGREAGRVGSRTGLRSKASQSLQQVHGVLPATVQGTGCECSVRGAQVAAQACRDIGSNATGLIRLRCHRGFPAPGHLPPQLRQQPHGQLPVASARREHRGPAHCICFVAGLAQVPEQRDGPARLGSQRTSLQGAVELEDVSRSALSALSVETAQGRLPASHPGVAVH